MSIQRRYPCTTAFGPLDQDDRRFFDHVLESKIPSLVDGAKAITIDMINGSTAGVVVVHESVGGTGREGAGAESSADRLHQGGLPRAQVPGEAEHRGRAEAAPQRFTEPVESVLVEEHAACLLPPRRLRLW